MAVFSKVKVLAALCLLSVVAANEASKDYKKEELKSVKSTLRQEPPEGWTCEPELYFLPNVCVCECGVRSEGCGYNIPVQGCEGTQLCSFEAECHDIPEDWRCNPWYYNVSDGCDCECGTEGGVDPDCFREEQALFGCAAFQICNVTGFCIDAPPTNQPTPAGLPDEWTCRNVFYNAADGCDCDCGGHDPDCDIPGATLFNCDDDALRCVEGSCFYPEDIPVPSFAPVSSYPTGTVDEPSFLQENPIVVVAISAAAALVAGLVVAGAVYSFVSK